MKNPEFPRGEIGKRLREVRRRLGIGIKTLAKEIGTSPGFISGVETGKNKPSQELTRHLALHYNVSIDWLLTGEGPMFREQRYIEVPERVELDLREPIFEIGDVEMANVPLHDIPAGAGGGGFLEHARIAELLPIPMKLLPKGTNPKNLLAHEVRGESMIPTLYDGDIVVVDTTNRHDAIMWDGKLVAMIDEDDDLVVKRLKVVREKPKDRRRKPVIKMYGVSENPMYFPTEAREVIGRVVLIIKRKVE